MHIPYSLATSYLLLGTSIGLVIWFAAGRFIDRDHNYKVLSRILLTAAILAVLGVIFATLHLGHMERFMNLVANPSSWLSREGLFAGAFTACTVLYFLLIKKSGMEAVKKLDPLLYLAVLAGVGTFICMGMIYASVQAIPAWNTTMVVLIDIFSGLLLGGFLFLVLAGKELPGNIIKPITTAIFLVLVVSLIVNIAYDAQVRMALSALSAQGVAVPSLMLITLIRLVIGLLVPVYLLAKGFKAKSGLLASTFSIALACVLIGEVTAKIMHFLTAVKGPLF
ncbi:dimethyl sulfoxide reductase anchor subunit family protein [Syntrophomonas curvata]